MARKPRILNIEVCEDDEGRFVVETYADGSVLRRPVEKGGKPRRKPRKPVARAWRSPNLKEP